MDFLDPYTLRARLFPAILAIAPPLVFVLVNLASAHKDIGLPQVLLTVAIAVLFFAFADIARRFGRRAEKKMFASSGGRPFPTVLRHRDAILDRKSRDQYHAFLAKMIGTAAPTPEGEAVSPEEADDFYVRCGNYLREQTRDQTKFNLLFAENITYGFRRNLFGIKWPGLVLNGITACASVYLIYRDDGANLAQYGTVLLVAAIHALYFLFAVSWKSVSDASDQYGRQLVLSCETLMNGARPL
jgi:hypothetical protein